MVDSNNKKTVRIKGNDDDDDDIKKMNSKKYHNWISRLSKYRIKCNQKPRPTKNGEKQIHKTAMPSQQQQQQH